MTIILNIVNLITVSNDFEVDISAENTPYQLSMVPAAIDALIQAVRNNEIQQAESIFATYNMVLDQIYDSEGNTLFNQVRVLGQPEMIALFLAKGATILNHHLVGNAQAIEQMIRELLVFALQNNNLTIAERVLTGRKVNLDSLSGDQGNTLLGAAVLRGNQELIALFLAHGACRLNIQLEENNAQILEVMQRILWVATETNNLKMVNYILDSSLVGSGAFDLSTICGENSNSLLHLAVLQGNIDLAALYIAYGVSVNSQNAAGQTPLYLALHNNIANRENMIEVLMELGGQAKCGSSVDNLNSPQ